MADEQQSEHWCRGTRSPEPAAASLSAAATRRGGDPRQDSRRVGPTRPHGGWAERGGVHHAVSRRPRQAVKRAARRRRPPQHLHEDPPQLPPKLSAGLRHAGAVSGHGTADRDQRPRAEPLAHERSVRDGAGRSLGEEGPARPNAFARGPYRHHVSGGVRPGADRRGAGGGGRVSRHSGGRLRRVFCWPAAA